MSGNFAIKGGGVARLMANAILNFHFDYLTPSLISSIDGGLQFLSFQFLMFVFMKDYMNGTASNAHRQITKLS